ncbi:hypothetical protein [Seohaeicola zhoushanensis]|uniref:Uncharacterized protein n=1 Tax=Seohaeicola zhoushanensis TaxID=1569283 RepID=A0A8J3GTP4_9RHOB|nr:hypothetical protein [Seohaeicola zhoushanensis]GHF33179.1 hypothetical protein GCM10017056_00740 [Seohaeicola zhoushanensis]
MTDDEFGPWIEHDGGTGPHVNAEIEIVCDMSSGGKRPGPLEKTCSTSPWWMWRWRKVRTGWFKSELRRVCDDPEFAPIIRYRIRKPRALRDLIELIANLPESVDA